ncbi:hypothetical protein HGM15179_011023 [Zosterops borbonicus]|uniref:Uncharacterized protein n=1 Tax=Zosterops borbonicus TaxID=364589 RepID=A0A8K1GDN3_9PASS|nr:hypothetical protein HGM15179_011023 [Zosterops borbonicus]
MLCPVLGPSIQGDMEDMEVLGSAQRRAVELVTGLENTSYKKLLRELGLFSLEEREAQGTPCHSTTT